MAKKKTTLSIDEIVDHIIDGKSYRQMAEIFGMSLSRLHDFTSKPEHSARVNNALRISADTYADKAEQILLEAEATGVEIQRARELAQYYKWKAAKRFPQVYSDKINLDHTTKGEKMEGTKQVFKIGGQEINFE